MVKCTGCRKRIPEGEEVYCEQCEAPLCPDCEVNGMCPSCAELWEAEIHLADQKVEEDII